MYGHSSMDDPKEGIKLGCQCAEFTFGAETTGRPGLYQPFDVFPFFFEVDLLIFM